MFSTHGSRMRYLSIYLMVAVTPENDARRPSRMSRLYSRPTRPPATSYCNRNLRSRLIFFGTLPTSNHDDGDGLSRPSPRGATAIPCKSGLRCTLQNIHAHVCKFMHLYLISPQSFHHYSIPLYVLHFRTSPNFAWHILSGWARLGDNGRICRPPSQPSRGITMADEELDEAAV